LDNVLAEHNKKLSEFSKELMMPESVPFLLEKLLKDFSGLTLLNIETLAPIALVQEQNKNEAHLPVLYRQAIRMTFSGEYQDLLAYVKKVEELPFPIWWQEVQYKITNFPQAQIELTVYTLSEHLNWIGV
jgi:MSHA biogenesis protein MshJ